MSTVKISELPTLPTLNRDTDQTLVAGVDLLSGITGKMTATVLAEGLYSHNVLNVGNTHVVFPNVVAQFVGESNNYVQINMENINANGSADIVITADVGDDATYYMDMGINNSNYNYAGYTYAQPLDGYLIMQGDDANTPGGNLVIGTTTIGKDISFVNGSITGDQIVMKYVYEEGLHLLHNPLFFADGTVQNTAPAPFAYSNSAYAKTNSAFLAANSAGSYANSAFGKANAAYETANSAGAFANTAADAAATARIAAATADSKAVTAGQYANSSFVVANNTLGVDAFQNTNIGLAWTKANNALANTTGILDGALTVTGNVIIGETIVFKDNTEMRYNPSASPATFLISSANGIQVKSGSKVFGFGTDGNFSVPRDLGVAGNTSIQGDTTITGNLVARSITTSDLISFVGATSPSTNALVEIIGSVDGAQVTPATDGYMLHVTGKDGISNKIVFDSFGTGAYPLVAGRSARGSANTPLATQNNDVLMRVSSGGYGNTGFIATGSAKLDFVAVENFTDATRGTEIQFWNTVPGTNTLNKIVTMNATHTEVAGYIKPAKGFIWYPRSYPAAQTAVSLSFVNDAVIKTEIAADMTVSFADHLAGKVVDMWITNTSGANRTVTHGCTALYSTTNDTVVVVPATSTVMLKYICFDETTANVHVAAIYG